MPQRQDPESDCVQSMIAALQQLSEAVDTEKLLATLADVVLPEASAQRGYVILRREGDLTIEVEATLGDKDSVVIERLPSLPVLASGMVASSVIEHVASVKKKLILEDPLGTPPFSADPYFLARQPESLLCLPIQTQSSLVGVLYLEYDVPSALTEQRLEVLDLFISHAAIWLENDLLLTHAQKVRDEAEDNARRSKFLAEAGEVLSQTLDYQSVIRRFARLAVQGLADWCIILLYEHGELRRVGGAHVDPRKQPLMEQLDAPHDERIPVIRAIRTRRPVLVEGLRNKPLPTEPRFVPIIRALGVDSALAVPIMLHGQVVGGINITSASPSRRFGPADVELLQEMARRAAIAIDNARLYANAQETIRLRDEFLTVASHELRTPMTSLVLAVQGLVELSSGTSVEQDSVSKSARMAERQLQRLTRLVRELLDLRWIESGHLTLELEKVELGALVREVVAQFALDLARAKMPLMVRATRPIVGNWDRSRVEQVVTNLLSNAIKFGGGRPIEITVDADAGMARLEVEDHGIGISPEQQQHIFERFGRAVSAHHDGGLGLGLYTSRQIVEAHHGSIHLESQPGRGATFTVEVPCETAHFKGQS